MNKTNAFFGLLAVAIAAIGFIDYDLERRRKADDLRANAAKATASIHVSPAMPQRPFAQQNPTFKPGPEMSTEGPNLVTSGTDDSAVGTVAWNNPGNITADDATHATLTFGGPGVTSHYLKGLNPGFTAVSGTISSVQLDIERNWNALGSGVDDSTVSLVVGGVLVGPNKAAVGAWPTSDTVQSYTWSIPADTTLTPAQAKAADFGAVLSVTGSGATNVASVDFFKFTVTYTSSSGVRKTESRSVMLRQVRQNEAVASERRVFFDLRDATDGITAEAAETSGQPQISVNGGAWTTTGIGALAAIVPSTKGRYYADLTAALVSNSSIGDVIETSYKSANTIETAGDTILVIPNLSIKSWISDSTPSVSSIRGSAVNSSLSRNDNDYRGMILVQLTGVNAGETRKISSYLGATRDFQFTGAAGDPDAAWDVAAPSGTAFELIGKIR